MTVSFMKGKKKNARYIHGEVKVLFELIALALQREWITYETIFMNIRVPHIHTT